MLTQLSGIFINAANEIIEPPVSILFDARQQALYLVIDKTGAVWTLRNILGDDVAAFKTQLKGMENVYSMDNLLSDGLICIYQDTNHVEFLNVEALAMTVFNGDEVDHFVFDDGTHMNPSAVINEEDIVPLLACYSDPDYREEEDILLQENLSFKD